MRRGAGPAGDPHAHDHEYRPNPDRFPVFEDGAAIFFLKCEYVEINGSYTDEARDETYYDEGYSCDKRKHIRFDLKEIREPVENGQELVKEADNDEIPEEVWVEIDELSNGANEHFDPEVETTFQHWLDDDTYAVFEKNG